MANGGIEISNPRILDAIREHRYGVLIEITNSIPARQKREDKKRQIKTGNALLQKAVGDSAKISTGIALIRNNEKEIKELDYLIRIKDYDVPLLWRASSRLLETNYLGEKDAKKLSNWMRLADNTGHHYLRSKLNPQGSDISRIPRGERKSYMDNLCKIKGSVLEFYVRELFGLVLMEDSAFALGAELRDTQVNPNQICYTDLIIAAPESEFNLGLEKIVKMYKGKQEIQVTFPNRK